MANNTFSPAIRLMVVLAIPTLMLVVAYTNDAPHTETPEQSDFVEQQLAASIMETRLVEAMNSIPNVQDDDLPVETFNKIQRRFTLMNNTNGYYIRSLQEMAGVPLENRLAFSLSEENRNLISNMLEIVRASGQRGAANLGDYGNFWLGSCVDDVIGMTTQNTKDFQTALKPLGSIRSPAKQIVNLGR
jgi:hypothetical protein